MLSKRIEKLSTSMTIAITTLALELKAQGKDVYRFQLVNQTLIHLKR